MFSLLVWVRLQLRKQIAVLRRTVALRKSICRLLQDAFIQRASTVLRLCATRPHGVSNALVQSHCSVTATTRQLDRCGVCGGCLASCGEQLFTHQQLCSQITSGLHLNYCTFVNMHFLSLVLSNGNIAGQIIPSEPLKWSPVMWPVSMCCWKEKNTLGNFTSYPWRSSRWKENRLERLTSVRSLASQLLSVQRAVVNSWVSHYL